MNLLAPAASGVAPVVPLITTFTGAERGAYNRHDIAVAWHRGSRTGALKGINHGGNHRFKVCTLPESEAKIYPSFVCTVKQKNLFSGCDVLERHADGVCTMMGMSGRRESRVNPHSQRLLYLVDPDPLRLCRMRCSSDGPPLGARGRACQAQAWCGQTKARCNSRLQAWNWDLRGGRRWTFILSHLIRLGTRAFHYGKIRGLEAYPKGRFDVSLFRPLAIHRIRIAIPNTDNERGGRVAGSYNLGYYSCTPSAEISPKLVHFYRGRAGNRISGVGLVTFHSEVSLLPSIKPQLR